jgi:hypothetical protein
MRSWTLFKIWSALICADEKMRPLNEEKRLLLNDDGKRPLLNEEQRISYEEIYCVGCVMLPMMKFTPSYHSRSLRWRLPYATLTTPPSLKCSRV